MDTKVRLELGKPFEFNPFLKVGFPRRGLNQGNVRGYRGEMNFRRSEIRWGLPHKWKDITLPDLRGKARDNFGGRHCVRGWSHKRGYNDVWI